MKKIIAMLALVGMLGLSACTSNETKNASEGTDTGSQTAVQESNELVIYTASAQDVIDAVIPEFEAKTGIKVELVTAGTGELLKRIEAEQAKPLGDIEWGGVVSVIAPKKELFEDYLSPNESAQLDSTKNTDGMITRNNIIPMVMIVNKNLIGDIKIEGYEDLLNPKLKGKIAFSDPAKSSTSFSHLVNILNTIGGTDESKGWDYVTSLTANLDGKLLASSSAVPKGVADGEYIVGLTHEELASSAVRDGSPVEIVYMKEGTLVSPGTVQIIKGAKNMENAKKFVDFITSKELQTLTSTELNMRASRSDVEPPEGLKAISEITIVPEDVNKTLENSQAWLDKFKDIFTS
ncbi:ABC transporter substrate-binding protein [Cohnella fermenti]|uniref:Extracellular solute-binding protein n=1 Tax=Cohnella fermenti TaxID=2565925 RepID=A0A4S4BYW1_9BACL|nr:ABC transporter substrate-binding protein [Cohnella fermenti]THF80371.1 extracellular solute-binding protein [Cohnella fermenti]